MDEEAELEALGGRIRTLRHRAKLTQEEVANSAGLHLTFINRIENGRRNPTYISLLKIAGALGVTVKRLV